MEGVTEWAGAAARIRLFQSRRAAVRLSLNDYWSAGRLTGAGRTRKRGEAQSLKAGAQAGSPQPLLSQMPAPKRLLTFFFPPLCWVFVAARGLSLVEVSGGYSSLPGAGFSLW